MGGFKSQFRNICNDHLHGSSYILDEIINSLKKHNPSSEDLIWAIKQMKMIDSSMVVIKHFTRELENHLNTDLHEFLLSYEQKYVHIETEITNRLIAELAEKTLSVLTHSHSQMVINVLEKMKIYGIDITVFQTHSHPGEEGRIQKKDLERLNINVLLIEDFEVAKFLQKVDAVFLGVDQYDEHNFVNKVGSFKIVSLAQSLNKCVFVLGDIRKKVDQIEPRHNLFEVISIEENVTLLSN
jgi:translation initiation factor 2B subunit (eIF-2B alpha/beta/delta family)